jgi:hypothetical protein
MGRSSEKRIVWMKGLVLAALAFARRHGGCAALLQRQQGVQGVPRRVWRCDRALRWRRLDDVEHATLEYVDWFNRRGLYGEIGMIPPAEFEAIYYHQGTPAVVAVSQ